MYMSCRSTQRSHKRFTHLAPSTSAGTSDATTFCCLNSRRSQCKNAEGSEAVPSFQHASGVPIASKMLGFSCEWIAAFCPQGCLGEMPSSSLEPPGMPKPKVSDRHTAQAVSSTSGSPQGKSRFGVGLHRTHKRFCVRGHVLSCSATSLELLGAGTPTQLC